MKNLSTHSLTETCLAELSHIASADQYIDLENFSSQITQAQQLLSPFHYHRKDPATAKILFDLSHGHRNFPLGLNCPLTLKLRCWRDTSKEVKIIYEKSFQKFMQSLVFDQNPKRIWSLVARQHIAQLPAVLWQELATPYFLDVVPVSYPSPDVSCHAHARAQALSPGHYWYYLSYLRNLTQLPWQQRKKTVWDILQSASIDQVTLDPASLQAAYTPIHLQIKIPRSRQCHETLHQEIQECGAWLNKEDIKTSLNSKQERSLDIYLPLTFRPSDGQKLVRIFKDIQLLLKK